ncbi:Flp pilus assembly protein CpaB [Sphingomicrobium nitratireducens]|uniref:Flp pilus assembly protein CpaB n=1 Tax=Sphingomicrobium nitratireducens TaxID=2964666 RepID=UPI002240182B|nr:Flp pilus assembly protein CpaB [Sphingomicrobium nitratireducens]
MQRQSLIAIAIAVVLGLVAVWVANSWFSAREARIEAANSGTQRIAVAAVPMNYGFEIKPEHIKFANYPADALPPGTFSSLEELLPAGKARHVLRPVQINQPMLAADLTGEGEGASIAAILPAGMRATTVQINAVSGVAGFIKPNDTVDVLITRQPLGNAGAGGQVTDVLLQNIRVIAMDQNAKDDPNSPANVSSTATLEVTPVDAQKLVLGQQLGSLSLVLRKPGEQENIPIVETVSLTDLRYELSNAYRRDGDAATEAAAPAPRPRTQVVRRPARTVRQSPPPPPANKVEVTRGTQSSEYEVGEYAR